MTIDTESLLQKRPERRFGRSDHYDIQSFYEYENPELAHEARRVHAQGYLDKSFVKDEALTDDGTLSPDIDKARGSFVEYYLASEQSGGSHDALMPEMATMRRIHIPEGEGLDALPAFRLCADHLDPLYREYLDSIEDPSKTVKEIAGLARTPNANPLMVFELLRDALQDGSPKEEVWFFSIVSDTYQSLAESFGPNSIRQIGTPVSLHDDRVGESIELVPALVKTDLFIDEVRRSFEASDETRQKIRLARSFMFFTEGMRSDELSVESIQLRDQLSAMHAAHKPQRVA